MPPRAVTQDLLLDLDPLSPRPLHRQLYDGLRDAILGGQLAPGIRVPAARVLAADLGVSRNTVNGALAQLVAEGYLEGRERSGTFVAARLPAARTDPPAAPAEPLSRRGAALVRAGMVPAAISHGPFRIGLPAHDRFPRHLWGRLVARRWRDAGVPLGYGDPAGWMPLRRAIAQHVSAARGARCTAEQVLITTGSQQGLDLAARVLLDPGDAAWMEDPGYPAAAGALLAAGARLVPVPVDHAGLNVEEGIRREPRARLAYVTPSHQFPCGGVLDATRRLALLEWAREAGAWILEDDYDSEFRYGSRPLACLQGLDHDGRVVYIGTFSKTLAPALRLGFVIVPPPLVEAFRAAAHVSTRHVAMVEQAALADFIGEGHFTRHLRQMRRLYAERQATLLAALGRELGGRLEVDPDGAGLHLVARLPAGEDDRAAAARAAAAGLEAAPLSRYAREPVARGALLLGYAGFTPAELERATSRLAAALGR